MLKISTTFSEILRIFYFDQFSRLFISKNWHQRALKFIQIKIDLQCITKDLFVVNMRFPTGCTNKWPTVHPCLPLAHVWFESGQQYDMRIAINFPNWWTANFEQSHGKIRWGKVKKSTVWVVETLKVCISNNLEEKYGSKICSERFHTQHVWVFFLIAKFFLPTSEIYSTTFPECLFTFPE